MNKKLTILLLILLVVMTGCSTKKSGTMTCSGDEISYDVTYKDNEVNNVSVTYNDCTTTKEKISLDNYFDKYCKSNYKGYSCSVNLSGNCVKVKTDYDYSKLSNDDLKKLQKEGFVFSKRKISKLENAITKSHKNIKCEYKESNKKK